MENTQLGGDQSYVLIRLGKQLYMLVERDVSLFYFHIPISTFVNGSLFYLYFGIKVMWNLYSGTRDRFPFEEHSFDTGILLCFNVAKSYYPNHVLRWFDIKQLIPKSVIAL